MAQLGNSANINFYINGAKIPAPEGWRDLEILATFDNEGVQANITTEEFTFVNEARQAIINYLNAGTEGGEGIFEGLPFTIEAISKNRQTQIFEGYLDLANEASDYLNSNRFSCRIGKTEGLNVLQDRASGITFGLLKEEGFITEADYQTLEYIVERPINPIEIITIGIMGYILTKELADTAFQIAKIIADTTAHTAGGVTGPIAGTAFAVAIAVLQVTLFVALLSALLKLAQNLINTLIPPKREHKISTFRKLLEKASEYLGYTFQSNIPELDNHYYLPSNLSVDLENSSNGFIEKAGTIADGIPNSSDYGYILSEFFNLAKTLFNAKYSIKNGELNMFWVDDEFYNQESNYIIPNVLLPQKEYNTNELKATKIYSFQTDINDTFTIDNFTGTNYEVRTAPLTINNPKNVLLKGLGEVKFNIALGNRKTKLNGVENVLASVLGLFDSVANVFGGNSNLGGSVKSKVGLLKMSNNNHTIPKILYLEGGKLPTNHRDVLSAKKIYEKYYYTDSFVQNDFYGQKEIYRNVRIPFGLEDFILLIQNNHCKDVDGNSVKIEKISWQLGNDTAIIDYYIRKKYTENLKETTIEG